LGKLYLYLLEMKGRLLTQTGKGQTDKQTNKQRKGQEEPALIFFSVHMLLFHTLFPGIFHESNIKPIRLENSKGVQECDAILHPVPSRISRRNVVSEGDSHVLSLTR
jgi:hypothetical protein